MKNPQTWRPSKFERRGGRLRAARDVSELGVGSRLVADLVAACYDEQLPLHARGRLLDMGCGKVPLYEVYRALARETMCIDWLDNEHIDLVCDLSKALPLPDGAFDTIVVSDVIEHLPDPALAWREMARLLAPGGAILLNVPFLYPIHAHPYDYFRYTRFGLERFAQDNALEVVLLRPVGGLLEVFGDTAGKVLGKLPLIGRPLAALQQSLSSRFACSRWGRKIGEATARNYPLGYFLVARKPA